MKILQLSTFDGYFGAGIAARRLHEALLGCGYDCDLFVREIVAGAPRTFGPNTPAQKFLLKVQGQLDRLPLLLYPNRKKTEGFNLSIIPSGVPGYLQRFEPDIVHLHWGNNFISVDALPKLQPLVWTLHDMWAFTGGCHYSSGCEGYLTRCGKCPILRSSTPWDVSRLMWREKRRAYKKIHDSLQIICPSQWLGNLVRQSPLLKGAAVHVIPNPISSTLFKPLDQAAARRLLNLPEGIPLLLFGKTRSADHRKGFDLLRQALLDYTGNPGHPELGLVTFGTLDDPGAAPSDKLRIWNVGVLQDEVSLAALYNAADIVAVPSREENLSNTIAEALSCGTPCLAFDIGGNSDLITHQINGYLAKPGDVASMAEGLDWILRHIGSGQRAAISNAAHDLIGFDRLLPRFLEVYRKAIAARDSGG